MPVRFRPLASWNSRLWLDTRRDARDQEFLPKSQVSRIAADLDAQVTAFRTRPLSEAGAFNFVGVALLSAWFATQRMDPGDTQPHREDPSKGSLPVQPRRHLSGLLRCR